MQDEQIADWTRNNRIGATVIVAEFNQRRLLEQLDDGADLTARKPICRQIRQQGHNIEYRRLRRLLSPAKHPTRDKVEYSLVASHDPNGSYHNTSAMSRHGNIGAPTCSAVISGNRGRLYCRQPLRRPRGCTEAIVRNFSNI